MSPFFRHNLDPERASARPATLDDMRAIGHLLVGARHHMLNMAGESLESLVGRAPSALLVADGRAVGAAVCGLVAGGAAWLRALALADGMPVEGGLARLMPALHGAAWAAGARELYYGGDSGADAWLAPRLGAFRYEHNTYILTYAKNDMDAPAAGSAEVAVRPARAEDLDAILAIDRACFEPQWVKDQTAIRPALAEAAFFVVAEVGGAPAGYAFAMSYFEGRQLHLVRIAVLPGARGRGIGVRLLAELAAFGRTRRAKVLTLSTQEYNAGAQRLYEWFGFRRTGERQLILRAAIAPPPA